MSRNENINTTKIEETIEKTEYGGTPRRRIGEIEMAEFTGFDEKGEPNEITYRRKKYKLETSKEISKSEDFFNHSVERDPDGHIIKVTFDNEFAKDLFYIVNQKIRNFSLRSIEESLKTDLAMKSETPGSGNNLGVVEENIVKRFMKDITSGFEQSSLSEFMIIPNSIGELSEKLQNLFDSYFSKQSEIDKRSVSFPANDWLSDISEMSVLWIRQLQESGVEVSIRTTKAYLGTRPLIIRNLNIGNIEITSNPEYEYTNENTILSGVLMSYEKLGIRYLKNVDIINYNRPNKRFLEDVDSFVENWAHKPTYRGKILLGIRNGGRPIDFSNLNDQENNPKVPTINQISLGMRQNDLLHELGHSLESLSKWSTSPQSEGFATAFECGFDFYLNRELLRYVLDYQGEVTKQQLMTILSSNPDMNNMVQGEIYGITSTFFSWLYENVGSNNFVRFYTYLTGDRLDKNTPKKEVHKCVGNVMESLGKIRKDHMWTWSSTDELIENFLDDINDRGGRKTKEKITSIS